MYLICELLFYIVCKIFSSVMYLEVHLTFKKNLEEIKLCFNDIVMMVLITQTSSLALVFLCAEKLVGACYSFFLSPKTTCEFYPNTVPVAVSKSVCSVQYIELNLNWYNVVHELILCTLIVPQSTQIVLLQQTFVSRLIVDELHCTTSVSEINISVVPS